MSESSEDAHAQEGPSSDSDAEDDAADEMAALRRQVEEKFAFGVPTSPDSYPFTT